MNSDESDLLDILYDRSQQPGKKASIVEAGMQQLPDWDKERLLAAAQGLERDGYVMNATGPLLHVSLTSIARKHVADQRAPLPSQAIHIGTNNHSPNQQLGAGARGTQTTTYEITRDDLEKVAALFREHGSELNLEPKLQRQANAQVATIEAQLLQDAPNPVIVREAGKSLKTIAEGALGNLVAAGLSTPGLWQWLLALPFN